MPRPVLKVSERHNFQKEAQLPSEKKENLLAEKSKDFLDSF
jgi:hypothetical protein